MQPWSGNNYTPFIYDFDGLPKDDFTQQFVTKVIRTHKGQCRSLPMYYRILAEAIDAEAYISYAPLHLFIRYPDADDLFPEEWVNVELTTHQYTPEFWYKEHFEITEQTIFNKVYLHPLTLKETIASQLADLAHGYWSKYRVYDDFVFQCASKSLDYYPQNPNALLMKGNAVDNKMRKHFVYNGYRYDGHTLFWEDQLKEISHKLDQLGWKPYNDGLIQKLDDGMEQARQLQQTNVLE